MLARSNYWCHADGIRVRGVFYYRVTRRDGQFSVSCRTPPPSHPALALVWGVPLLSSGCCVDRSCSPTAHADAVHVASPRALPLPMHTTSTTPPPTTTCHHPYHHLCHHPHHHCSHTPLSFCSSLCVLAVVYVARSLRALETAVELQWGCLWLAPMPAGGLPNCCRRVRVCSWLSQSEYSVIPPYVPCSYPPLPSPGPLPNV